MPAFFAAMAARLGVQPGLALETDVRGVVVTSTASPGGDRLLHVLNPTGNDARVTVARGRCAVRRRRSARARRIPVISCRGD